MADNPSAAIREVQAHVAAVERVVRGEQLLGDLGAAGAIYVYPGGMRWRPPLTSGWDFGCACHILRGCVVLWV
ncbi:MAG: hypothetical protein R3E42_17990 [Burkholderiaceae bacterium]